MVSLLLPGQETKPGYFTLDRGKLGTLPFDIRNYVEFMQTLDKFDRKLGGCPEDALHAEECVAGAGIFDVKLWKKVRRLGLRALRLSPARLPLAQATATSPDNAKD